MRRIGIFVLAWVGLFALTVGIRMLTARSETGARQGENATDDSMNEALQVLLETKPRKNSFLIPASGAEASSVDARIRAFMMEHDTGLRRCRAEIMAVSTNPKEIFELSFRVRMLGRLVIEDAVLERSTLTLTREQEKCITDEFERFELGPEVGGTVPDERLAYQFCFGRLKK